MTKPFYIVHVAKVWNLNFEIGEYLPTTGFYLPTTPDPMVQLSPDYPGGVKYPPTTPKG